MIEVGSKWRYEGETVTVVYVNSEYVTVEYDNNDLSVWYIASFTDVFSPVPQTRKWWINVYYCAAEDWLITASYSTEKGAENNKENGTSYKYLRTIEIEEEIPNAS